MMQKLIKVGNSFAITIPKQFIKERKWKAGQTVHVDEIPQEDGLTIFKDEAVAKKYTVTPEFKNWLDAFNKKYKAALTELAQK